MPTKYPRPTLKGLGFLLLCAAGVAAVAWVTVTCLPRIEHPAPYAMVLFGASVLLTAPARMREAARGKKERYPGAGKRRA